MATQTEVVEPPKREPEAPAKRGAPKRVQVAQLLAFVALLAAFVGALGPAAPIRATYSWPPRTLPQGSPSTVWYTPLLLTHRIPESVSADIPCRLPHPLSAGNGPVTVLATARSPDLRNGLAVTSTGRRLTVSIGTQVLHRLVLPDRACTLHLAVANGIWAISSDVDGLAASGRVSAMPTVNGLFSGVDLRASIRPSIDVSVIPQSARPVFRQTLGWSLSAVCGLLALLLVAYEPGRRRGLRAPAVGRVLKAAHPADAAVGVLLPIWLVLSPVNPDDGWVATTERMFRTSGGFSNYFDALATNLPLGYWLEWIQHWLTERTTSLVLYRAPALVSLVVAWLLCRWVLERILGPRASRGATPWALAAMFVISSFSWDMTLRPEATIALLVAGALAATVAFAERQSVAPLVVAVICVALAGATHPAGIVSVAPLLAIAPTVVRWARSHFSVAATIVPAAIALAVTVATVGTDVSHRARDVTTFRTYGDATLTWRDELLRYDYLTYPFFGTPLRRASIALVALVVLVYVVRGRRLQNQLLDLPARALVISLALLVLNPDKLSWHFGTLLALASVAAASETSRLRTESAGERTSALPYVWIAGAVVVAAWSWPVRMFWNSLDLRTLSWTLGLESGLPVGTLAALVPLLALLAVGLVGFARDGRMGLRVAPARVAPWSLALVVVPLLVFTMGVLSADAAKTDSWTLTTQNIDALHGAAGCGLADDMVAPVPSSMRPLSLTSGSGNAPVPSWVPPPPIDAPRFMLGPLESGSARTPWFALGQRRAVGVLVAGAVTAETKLTFEFAHLSGGRARVLASKELSGGTFQRGLQDTATWLVLLPSDRSLAPSRANAVRVALAGSGMNGEAVAVTSPVTYATEPVARTLRSSSGATLTNPFVLPYFPCAREPILRGGTVEMPIAILSFPSTRAETPTGRGQVFTGVMDVYAGTRLPLLDARDPQTREIDLVLYDLEPIPGGVLAPPDSRPSDARAR